MHLSTSYHRSVLHASSLIIDCSQYAKADLKAAIDYNTAVL